MLKKISLFFAASLLLSACANTTPVSEEEPDEAYYEAFDEEARQFTYSYFGNIFFYDKSTGEKTGLTQAYNDSGQDMTWEEYQLAYSGVIGGNVLGFKRQEDGSFRVDVVLFEEFDVRQLGFEMFIEDDDGEVLITYEEQIEETALVFEDSTEIDNLGSPSGNYEAQVIKNLVAVDFYTPDGVAIPASLGRYDLVLDDGNEEVVVDFSFDPFSTNLPFEIRGFSDDGNYLEYFEQSFGRLFNLYDIEKEERTDIELAGIFDGGFWNDGKFIVCTSGGDTAATIALISPGKWEIKDHEYIEPEELNDLRTKEEIWDFLLSNAEEGNYGCTPEELGFTDK
jgi:hypothetical protein